tara:strand:- start:661 stop:858 length:198 start_codon:yes stop_codon:yes gene_type:complete
MTNKETRIEITRRISYAKQNGVLDSVSHSDKDSIELWDDMQYYMEYCQRNGYVTPKEWIEKHKHF